MIALVSMELRRYLSRRAVRATGVLALLAILAAAVVTFINSDNSAAAVQRGLQQRERLIEQCKSGAESGAPDFGSPEDCETAFGPEEAFDPRFRLTGLTDVVQGLSFLLVILGIGLGATLIGAEWGAGTMTTVLTWEPRRTRVLAAKVLAAMIFVALAVVLVLAALVVILAPVAMLRGTTAGVDGAWFAELASTGGRSAIVSGLAAAIGFAIASMARNTAAALIVAFVYFAVIENVIRGLRPNWARWLPGDNMALFVIGGEEMGFTAISETRALVTIVLYAALFSFVAVMVFRARDVT